VIGLHTYDGKNEWYNAPTQCVMLESVAKLMRVAVPSVLW